VVSSTIAPAVTRLEARRRAAGSSWDRLSVEAQEAWRGTFLGSLAGDVTAKLLDRAVEMEVGAGEVFYRGASHEQMALLALVVDGLLRGCMVAADGRELTVRYASSGAVLGVRSVILGGAPGCGASRGRLSLYGGDSFNGMALHDSHLLVLCPRTFLRVAQSDVTLAWALAEHVAREACAAQRLLAEAAFLPVRCRVARHLLDLAIRENGELVVQASHQDIADAIGSVREVVSRTLARLEVEGLVRRVAKVVVLQDPPQLHDLARGHKPHALSAA
jgi:CRP-like cAMP-binding protein